MAGKRDFSRRAFLASTASVGAAMAARGAFAQAAAPAEVPQKKLGYAIVGIGSLAMNQILPAFAQSKLAKVTALVSGHPDKAKQQAAKYGVDPKNIYNYENYDTIKDNPEVDIIYIVLPNSMHAEYTIRGAKAGKHILCEKPMANTVEECQAMIDACAAAKKKLLVAYRMRYEPMTIKAIEMAQSPQTTGVIKWITAEAGYNSGDPTQWRLKKAMAGGGPVMDMGIYGINAVRYLSKQEPSELIATTYTSPNDPRFKEVEETMTINMKFASGMMASVLTSYGFNCNRYRLYGTRGQLESESFQQYSGNHLYQPRGNNRQEVAYTPVNHFAVMMDHMVECVINDKTPLTPGEEGRQDLKIMMAAYRSVAEGKSVKLV